MEFDEEILIGYILVIEFWNQDNSEVSLVSLSIFEA